MRVAVFGATGRVGRLLVARLVGHGHEVTAFARTPGKLEPRAGLRSVPGSLTDPAVVGEVVRAGEAVLSVMGPGTQASEMPSLTTGYRNLVAAMEQHGVRRLVALGTPSIADPADGRELRVRLMVRGIRTLQPFAYDAITDIGRTVRGSGLDWTLVRVPLLTDRPETAAVRERAVGEGGGLVLSRANAAAYFERQLTARDQIGRAPLISDR